MKELTSEMKAKYFAAHFHQIVFRNKHWLPEEPNESVSTYILNTPTELSEGYLSLRPLEAISDEDAIEVARLNRMSDPSIFRNEKVVEVSMKGESISFWIQDNEFDYRGKVGEETIFYDMNSGTADYLRSRGYALSFGTLSVDQLIQAGWLQLTPNNG